MTYAESRLKSDVSVKAYLATSGKPNARDVDDEAKNWALQSRW